MSPETNSGGDPSVTLGQLVEQVASIDRRLAEVCVRLEEIARALEPAQRQLRARGERYLA